MLMRRTALDQVGLFDEGYWMYMEDLDLCYRLAEAGWTTWYEPSVSVVHVKAGSSGSARPPRLNVAFHYGMLRFYRTHYAPRRSRFVNAAVYAGIATKLALSLARSAIVRGYATMDAAIRRSATKSERRGTSNELSEARELPR
jgi:GT2 family glycosyltransferase